MSTFRLIRHDPYPPGEFMYSQNVDGKVYAWSGDGLSLRQQAERIAKFRSANGIPRPSIAQVMEDIDIFTCQRLSNSKRWCHDDTTQKVYSEARSSGGGGCCGAAL